MTTEEEVIETKQLRKDMDALIQRMDALPKSRPTSLSITNAEQSVMWLGMNLKRINEVNPYPNSKNPDNVLIEPTADGLKFSGNK